MRTAIIMFATLSALATTGCSHVAAFAPDAGTGDGDTDADMDADTDADTDTDFDIWDWTCPVPFDTACDDFEVGMPSAYYTMVDVPSTDVTFIHASRSPVAILAERTVGEAVDPIVLLLRDGYDDIVEVGLISPPAEQLEAIDIASPGYLGYGDSGLDPPDAVLGYAAVALLCGASSCALYGLAVDTGQEPIGLEPIPGGEVPLPESRAMTWIPPYSDDISISERACVAGDGVACFDGTTWTEEVATGGDVLNAIDAEIGEDGSPHGALAAGENGRIVTVWSPEATEIDSGTSMNLTAISVHDGIWAAGGETGFAFGDAEHAIACESESPYTAVFVHEEGPSSGSLLSLTSLAEDHAVELVGTSAGFVSCVQPEPFSRPPVNADYMIGMIGCIDAICGYALTDQGLYQRTEYGGGFE